MTADLAAFLLTCLAADAQVAQAATRDARPMAPKVDDTWRAVRDEKRLEWWVNAEFTGSVAGTGYVGNSDSGPLAVHIALHDPAFVLADITAKKAIVERLAAYPGEYSAWDQERHLGEPPWKPTDPALIAWERAHGHDVRLKCYPEFGCQFAGDEDVQDLALDVLRLLAQPYRGRPGWSDEWETR